MTRGAVFSLEKESVENTKITQTQMISGIQRPLVVFTDGDNDIFLEGHKGLSLPATNVDPVFPLFAILVLIATSSVGLAHRQEHGIRIHANERLFSLHGFLKFRRQRFNARS